MAFFATSNGGKYGIRSEHSQRNRLRACSATLLSREENSMGAGGAYSTGIWTTVARMNPDCSWMISMPEPGCCIQGVFPSENEVLICGFGPGDPKIHSITNERD